MPVPFSEYRSVPCFELPLPEAQRRGISLSVWREDLNHPDVSGNKWWKLRYNLAEARTHGYSALLTFGGAFSNHIYATAAAAPSFGLASIGVIRGEAVSNPTLRFAAACGMQLHFITRSYYRQKTDPQFLAALLDRFGSCYVLPEGGTNLAGVQSCAEWGERIWQQQHPDVVCLPVGTGGTMAGLICGLAGRCTVVGIPVLKDAAFLREEIAGWVYRASGKHIGNWRLETDFHGGGYGKSTPGLLAFIDHMWRHHELPLEPVYSAKMVWGVCQLIAGNVFNPGTRVLMLHTGGLQARGAPG